MPSYSNIRNQVEHSMRQQKPQNKNKSLMHSKFIFFIMKIIERAKIWEKLKRYQTSSFLCFFLLIFSQFLLRTLYVIDSCFYSQFSFWLPLLISWYVLVEIQMFHNKSSVSAMFIFPKEEF